MDCQAVGDPVPGGSNFFTPLSMEKNFLSCHPEIKEKIIDLFAQIKTRRMGFIFK
jgi:hypothetical protein